MHITVSRTYTYIHCQLKYIFKLYYLYIYLWIYKGNYENIGKTQKWILNWHSVHRIFTGTQGK